MLVARLPQLPGSLALSNSQLLMQSIFSELVSLLGSFNFKLDKLVGVSTDGASVMVGCESGVVTRLG